MKKDDFLNNLLENKLFLDCTSIKLTNKDVNGNLTCYSGPGYISQEQDGTLSFKIYCKGKLDPRIFFSRINQVTLGKLIEEHHYYNLEANSIDGQSITTHSIIPNFHGGAEIEGFTITGICSKIYGHIETSTVFPKTLIKIYYKGKYKTPSNTIRKTETTIGKEKRGEKVERSVTQFEIDNYDFEILTEEDCTIMVIITEEEVDPLVISQRANEGFQFVTANNQHMAAISIARKNQEEFIVFRQQNELIKPKLLPPISLSAIDRDGYYWKLFCAFFKYCLAHKEQQWHPLYSLIYNVIESSKASLEAHALTLTVAIEGILKIGYANIGIPSKETLELIDTAIKEIEQSKIDPSLIARLIGAMGAMKFPRAKDKLIILKNDGVINDYLYKAWDGLRNSSAHSDELELANIQELINDTNKVCVLFYMLIFDIIGYEGEYTDYSTFGFPNRIKYKSQPFNPLP